MPQQLLSDAIPQYPTWGAVPTHLASRSRIERELGLSVRGLPVAARVYQMTNHRWIALFDTRVAKPKKRLSAAQTAALAAGRHQLRYDACPGCGADVLREELPCVQHEYPGWCEACADRARRQTVCARARRWWDWPNLVVLDTETTGLTSADEIVEIAVVHRDGEVLFESLVRPTQSVHPDAARVHRIDAEKLRHAPRLPEIAAELTACLQDRPIVIYNAAFDCRLLQQSFARYGLAPPHANTYCLMELYAEYAGDGVAGDYRWVKLEAACRWHDITVVGASHRARADAERARLLLVQLVASEPETTPTAPVTRRHPS